MAGFCDMAEPTAPDEPNPTADVRTTHDRTTFGWVGIVTSFVVGTATAVAAGLILGPDVVPVSTTTVHAPGPPARTTTVVKIVPVGSSARPCSGDRVAGSPPYEPNDNASEAYGPLHSGQPIDSTLPDLSDTDFFALCVKKPTRVAITIRSQGRESFDTPKVTLLDDGGQELREIDVDSDATLGRITAKLRRGRYFIRLSLAEHYSYELEVDSSQPLSTTLPIAQE